MILGDVIRINAERTPNKPAFVLGSASLTFSQYNERVNRLANALLDRGLGKGDRVAVLSSNRLEFAETYGAAEKGGFIAVPLNYRLDAREIAYILQDSNAKTVVVEHSLVGLLGDVKGLDILLFGGSEELAGNYESSLAVASPGEPLVRIDRDDIVYMMYTGGTTGRPKGVLLSHGGQMANAKCMLIEIGVQPQDTLLTVMPLYHIGGKTFSNTHFQRGCTNVLLPSFDALEVIRQIVERQIHSVLLAPTMVRLLLDSLGGRRMPPHSLKRVYYSSAPMPVNLLREGIATFGNIFIQFYGLTESGPSATILKQEDHKLDGSEQEQKRLASAGKPMIHNEVQVIDETGREAPMGQIGEVRIKSDLVMCGYWKNAEETSKVLRDGWVYSHDLGWFDEEGYLFIVGRTKDVIISGGENIYPREIEELLNGHPAIKEVAVVGVPDEKWGEAVKAVVVLEHGATASEEEIIEYCRSNLASYKKPRSVDFRDALPRSPLGKILKGTIREEYWRGLDRKV